MVEILRWLITVEVIGLVSMPICWLAFPYLRDRGVGLVKPLGLLLVGTVVWLFSDFGLLSNKPESYWIVVVGFLFVSIWILSSRKRRFRRFLLKEWPALLVGEALFLVFFAVWVLIRSHQPDISGTEKPMELLMLNAVTISENASPVAPWLAGEPVAYYYFGYWILGGVGLMSGVTTSIGFNLSLALIAGMSASAVFSVAYGMILPGRLRDRMAVPLAAFAALLLLGVSNYAGLWEFGAAKSLGSQGFYDWLAIDGVELGTAATDWRPDTHWWWWHSSRVINTFYGTTGLDFTIQEFPFFSFLLGDLHPHLISIPFVLLLIGLVFNLFLTPSVARPQLLAGQPLRWLLLSVVLGAVGFINAWDLGFAVALILIVATIKLYRNQDISLPFAVFKGLVGTLLLIVPGILLFSNFYFGSFNSQVDWSAPLGAAEFATRPIHMLTVWGLFIVLLAPLWLSVSGRALQGYITGRPVTRVNPETISSLPKAKARANWSAVATTLVAMVLPYGLWVIVHLVSNDAASVGDLPRRVWDVLPIATISGLAILSVLHFARRPVSNVLVFTTTLMALCLYMIYGVELLYINDLFGGRMNTVFKLYYQVWIVLALVGSFGLHFWIRNHQNWSGFRRSVSEAGGVVVVVMAISAIYYPVASIDSRTDSFSGDQTLDGIAFIGKSQMAEREAINWLLHNARGNAVLVEAIGESYSDFGRLSSSTGIPTVLGWPFHEEQWRGSRSAFENRIVDVERIYSSDDIEEITTILDLYKIDYVIVGPRERSTYPDLDIDLLAGIGKRVFPQNSFEFGLRDYVIFDVGRS